MKKKYALAAMAALLCSVQLTACGGSAASETTAAQTTSAGKDDAETTSAETLDSLSVRALVSDELPERDFEGAEFRISVTDKYAYEMDVTELSGDVCDDAVYNRNRKIEERFNVTVKNVVSVMAANDDQSVHVGYIRKSIMAGDSDFELAALYIWRSGLPILDGLYVNWYDVPYINFDQPWWVSRALDAFTIGDNLYIGVGDLSITTLTMSYVMLFNKDIAASYDVPNLYETVSDGKWTIDYLTQLTSSVYSDLNGDGARDKTDLYGFITDKVTSIDAYLPSFDQPLVSRDSDGYPKIVINCDKTVSAVEKIYKLFWESDGTYVEDVYDDKALEFRSNQALISPVRMYEVFNRLRDMDTDYGIIPYPKWDEAQENYLTNTLDNYSALGIPVTSPDLEFTGIITEALTAESYRSVMPAYYDVALKVKFTRDEQSVEMLDLIMDGRTYDFSILHGDDLQQLPYLVRNLVAAKKYDFASKYASVEEKMQAGMQKLIEKYTEIE